MEFIVALIALYLITVGLSVISLVVWSKFDYEHNSNEPISTEEYYHALIPVWNLIPILFTIVYCIFELGAFILNLFSTRNSDELR